MKFRTYITKSRAGHYSVTIYELTDTGKRWVFSQNLIDTLHIARWHAGQFFAEQYLLNKQPLGDTSCSQ